MHWSLKTRPGLALSVHVSSLERLGPGCTSSRCILSLAALTAAAEQQTLRLCSQVVSQPAIPPCGRASGPRSNSDPSAWSLWRYRHILFQVVLGGGKAGRLTVDFRKGFEGFACCFFAGNAAVLAVSGPQEQHQNRSNDHAPQGMECCTSARWLVANHQRSTSAVDQVAHQRSSVFEATSEGPPRVAGQPSATGQSSRPSTRGGGVDLGSCVFVGGGTGSGGRVRPHFLTFARGAEENEGPVSGASRGGSHCIFERVHRACEEVDCCLSKRSQPSAGGSCEGSVQVVAGGARSGRQRGSIGGTHPGVCRGRVKSRGSSTDVACQFRPRAYRIASVSVRVAERELGFAFAVAVQSRWRRTRTQAAKKSGKFHGQIGTIEPWSWGRSMYGFRDCKSVSRNEDSDRQCGSKLAFQSIQSFVWVIRQARYGSQALAESHGK